MPGNPVCTLFIGNLDEKVDERVLYEILIQAGPVVDLYIPRDKETNRHKGYGFAEYETEDIAQYAIKLFTGLVCLNNRTLRFAISGQDKVSPTQNTVKPPSSIQTPPAFGKQKLPASPYSPAEMISSRHSPYLSPVPSYPSAYNSRGAIKNGYNSEKFSPQSQPPYYNNSKVVEAKRLDSCLTSIHHMGHRSSVHGSTSGYAYAHPSY
ncbi:uncharacterized protein LOC131034777 [Cryptomeria japonica]|uniref:uncharacterized protein LOC131034777 n=1 Tax=Cryptomeria japonica TaxID=3369 RepID=UPI0025AD80AA|nr:uncharacterized protein LOC131034777 [Cryptomeria japonica]